jgi:16S rRNA (uracil1498-N3)-methyltransferase
VIKFEDKEKGKHDRWKRIAVEASRQSGRFSVPEVIEPTPLRGILHSITEIPNRWVFYEREKEISMKDVMSSQKEGAICVVIGPEGGIEEMEIEWLKENGFTPCTLGENIFRTETTPLVILSIILYEYNKK